MSLRDQLDLMMPGWDRWYPSVFDAAVDLGILRARVCPPSSLLLSSRHAGVQQEAVQAFREKWYVEDDPLATPAAKGTEAGARAGRDEPAVDPEQSAARRLLAQALAADIPDLDLADEPAPPVAPRRRKRRRR